MSETEKNNSVNEVDVIDGKRILKIHERIKRNFVIMKDKKIDFDTLQLMVAYNIQEHYHDLNGLLWKERNRLADLDGQLKQVIAQAYDTVKTTKRYDINEHGMKILLSGNKSVVDKQLEYDTQNNFIKYLENEVTKMSYLNKDADTIVSIEKTKSFI